MTVTPRAKLTLLAAALVIFFPAVLLVALPTVLVNRPEVREAIQRYLSTAAGGTVAFDRVRLSIFPRICASIEDLRLDLPNEVTARAAEVDLCLRLLPLLRGRIMADSAHIRFPEIELTASWMAARAPRSDPADILRLLREAAGRLKYLPEAEIEMIDGRLKLSGPRENRWEIQNANLSWLRRGTDVRWAIEARSNFFISFSSTGRLDTGSLKGTAAFKTAEFQAHRLYAWVSPDDPFRVRDARLDLEMDVRWEGPERLNAAIRAQAPAITLGRQPRDTRLSIERMRADVDLSPQRLAIEVHECVSAAPQAAIGLSLVVDEQAQPRIDIRLNGRVDAGEARQAALALLPESRDVREVFDVLRGGEIPAISVSLAGSAWNELAAPGNLQIEGRLENGRVHLPWIGLDLDSVSGEVLIAGGVLEGRALKARYGKTRGENGTLRVGLSPAQPVLRLDIHAQAELAELPAILARVVSDPTFRNELTLVQEFSGTARGTLRLDGTHTNVRVGVQASELDVKARRRNIPYPFRFQGGEIAYDGDAIALKGVDVSIGNSTLFKYDMTLGLTSDLPVDASSAKAVVDLAETFNLFRDRPPFNHLQRLGGIVTFNRWQLAGRLPDPATWKLASAGTVQNLAVESELLPGVLSLPSGSFDWLGQTIRYSGAGGTINQSEIKGLAVEGDWTGPGLLRFHARELEASLPDMLHAAQSFPSAARYAGALSPAGGTARMRDVRFQTKLLPEGLILDLFKAELKDSRITSALIGIPLTLTAGSIDWRDRRLDIRIEKARLGQSETNDLSIVGNWGDDRNLEIQADRTVIAFGEVFARLLPAIGLQSLRQDVRDIRGALTASTFRFQCPLWDPQRWRLHADARITDIVVITSFLDDPIELVTGRLTVGASEGEEGGGNALRADSVRVRAGTDEALLTGDIALSEVGIALNFDVMARAIDWRKLEKISDRIAERGSGGGRPVRGRLAFRVENLAIDRLRLEPVYATAQLEPQRVRIEIEQAGVCGMRFIGRVAFDGPIIDAYLVPIVDVAPLESVVSCLTREASIYTGNFNLNGALRVKAPREKITRAMSGELALTAEDGTIRQSVFFARLFALLNLTEIYRGTLPDLNSQGLDYKRMTAAIEVKDGKIRFNDWSIDGRTLWIGSRGEIDIDTQQIDFTVMVSPFKTIDRIINSIPGLRWILGGRLVAVPMRAAGSLDDPQMIPLSPSAVGTSIFEMIERTLLLPVRVIQPLIPGMQDTSGGTISR